MNKIDQKTVYTIKALCADMIQKANSGHPGLPLGAAGFTHVLWSQVLNHDAKHPEWVNRDRFILSAGHGSSMLYSLLHLYGYGLTMDDLKQFRQLGSLTPGHPEYGHTVGVDATTGPLGQGLGMAVGMAMGQAHLATVFNKPGYDLFDHYVYALAGDGCMMEGISSEALSLAGTLKLEKLIILYDSNNISIEGNTNITFTENVSDRVKAFGFETLTVKDGDNLDEVLAALEKAKTIKGKPKFIEIKTTIGKDSPNEGSESTHGAPLGVNNIKALKEKLGLPQEDFYVPEDVYDYLASTQKRVDDLYDAWTSMQDKYFEEYPEMKIVWEQYFNPDFARIFKDNPLFWANKHHNIATRAASGETMNLIKDFAPNFIGGSADLGPSNKTVLKGEGEFSADNYGGRNIHFGVREQAMAAVGNGLMLYGGLKAYVATFFVFSDYVKPMARLSSLMKLPLTYVFTHDSIGVGEDGPTHEPVEQLTMLRAMPNMYVFRPCDEFETKAGWYVAMSSKETPTSLILSRQDLPKMVGSNRGALRGGYIIDDCMSKPDIIIIASGSEVDLAVKAKEQLKDPNLNIRIVSMPCQELFREQSEEYKESILPSCVENRIIVEAGSRLSWGEFAGFKGKYVTMDTFGASGKPADLFKEFHLTVEDVIKAIKEF